MSSHLYAKPLWNAGLALLVSGCLTIAIAAAPTATYTVTFDSTWSAATHPEDFPSNAHFSSLIGGTHNAEASFWDSGELASPGIQAVAETGSPDVLRDEINAAIMAGTARDVIAGPGLASPGSASASFDIHQSHPLVSLITMVAPSPDWFIGVHDLPLFDNGRWVEEVEVIIFPYDAGTDSGLTYTSSNVATIPPAPIALLQVPPVLVEGIVPPMGTLTFRRTDLVCQVALNQASYTVGDTIATETLRLESQREEVTTVEVGIWFQAVGTPPELPAAPISIVNEVVALESGNEMNFDPVSLLDVTDETPPGPYVLGCRAIDPVTKALRYESIQTVEVMPPAENP